MFIAQLVLEAGCLKTTVGDELCVVPKGGADRDVRPYKNAFLDSLSITITSNGGVYTAIKQVT